MKAKAIVEKMPNTELRRLLAKNAGDEQTTMSVLINPEMAADALSRNGINRPVRQRHREFLARQITEGRWRRTHQGIAFSRDGELLDGQHRLLAVTDARQAIEMCVSMNVPREAFAVIDYGAIPRSLADVTGLDPKAVQPVAFIYRETADRTRTYKLDVDEFAPYWATFGQASQDLYAFCSKGRRIMSSSPVRAAAIYVAKTTGDDTGAFSAYRALVMQAYAEMPPAVQALNRQFITDDIRFPIERFVRAVTAFERQDVGRLQVRDVLAKAADYRAKIRALVQAHARQIWKIKGEPK